MPASTKSKIKSVLLDKIYKKKFEIDGNEKDQQYNYNFPFLMKESCLIS
jgi:hypothetical protein